MQTVLVAGGAGFIGSHLCEKLLNSGYSVVCIDNLITGDKKNIEKFSVNSSFLFIEHDITDNKTKLGVPHVDYIFHLASPASPNKKSPRSYIAYPIETMLANSYGTYNLLQLAKQDNAKFLFASTSEIYGNPLISPQKEDYFGNVNPNGIRSVYDEAKRFGEAMTMAYLRKFGMDTRIVRIFNTYGPQMQVDDGRVVSNFLTQSLKNESITIYGDGKQTRSFCYVSDMIEGLMKALFTDGTKGLVVNLGNPDERTVLELATMVKDIVGSESEIKHEEMPEDDPKVRKPDITLAREKLNWEPKVPIMQGLKETKEYFEQVV